MTRPGADTILSPHQAVLLTDFYELTMMAAHTKKGSADRPAIFEYFYRQPPQHNGFCLFAGLDDLLRDLENMAFDAGTLEWLASLGTFDAQFIERLRGFRFSGDVWAVAEGTPIFPYEPVVRVQASIADGQLIETLLLNRLNYQTLIATKAARVCYAAEGEPVVDFGLRRAQGPDGGVSGSRAAYIGGCSATSNVLAGKLLGIPLSGTMAHSWILSFRDEREAFEAYMDVFPDRTTLLVDTYDTARSGIPAAVQVFTDRRAQGWAGRPGVRLDSGDLAYLSKLAFQKLLAAGFADAMIVGSNQLNEDLIADLKRQGAKINAWGVGTDLLTGGSEPALGGVYKLVAIEEGGRMASKMKVSSNPEKTTDPGAKAVIRFLDDEGHAAGDVLFAADEDIPAQAPVRSHDRVEEVRVHTYPANSLRYPLLEKVMEAGHRLQEPMGAADIRAHAEKQLQTLRPELRRLRNPDRYWVGLSSRITRTKVAEILRLTREG